MKPTRRSFLAGAGMLAASAATAPLHAVIPKAGKKVLPPVPVPVPAPNGQDAWLASRPQSELVSQFQWTQDTFQPFLNTNFQVNDSQGKRIVLRLISVQDIRKQNSKSTTAFALGFQLVSGTGFGQGTYEFYNPQLGKFLLFVVAANKSKAAPYVAVVNRL